MKLSFQTPELNINIEGFKLNPIILVTFSKPTNIKNDNVQARFNLDEQVFIDQIDHEYQKPQLKTIINNLIYSYNLILCDKASFSIHNL